MEVHQDQQIVDREPNEISFEHGANERGYTCWTVNLGNNTIGYITVSDKGKAFFKGNEAIDQEIETVIKEAFDMEFPNINVKF